MKIPLSVRADAPSRIAGHGPVGIIDIGSNSVRLVIYERLARAPTPLFNEKALCGLGRGLSDTGKLDGEAIDRAIGALQRFSTIARQLKCVELVVLATAAVREAENGLDFLDRVKDISGVDPIVLSGPQEAHYSALGVLCGLHKPDGIIGDMGGGSLEIADVHDGAIGPGATFKLGGLYLQDRSRNQPKKAAALAISELSKSDILSVGKGRHFYAIGGTWRSLATLHMQQRGYPLHVLHNYAVPAKEMAVFCAQLVKNNIDEVSGIEVVSKNRRPLLAYGAAVLQAVIEHMKPSDIVISALGVREGLLFDRLDKLERAESGLLLGARELSFLRSRSPESTTEVFQWTNSLFSAIGIEETAYERELREAACLLSDLGWRAHPDYRGEQSFNTIAHAALVGIDHPGRVFVSLAAYFRHQGQVDDRGLPPVASLISEPMLWRARILGLGFRIAYLMSAAVPGLLALSCFRRDGDTIAYFVDESLADQVGERLQRRIAQLQKLTGIEAKVVVKTID